MIVEASEVKDGGEKMSELRRGDAGWKRGRVFV
jgi:hypothetical protein